MMQWYQKVSETPDSNNDFKISSMIEHEKFQQVEQIKLSEVKYDQMFGNRWIHLTLKTISSIHSSGEYSCDLKNYLVCVTLKLLLLGHHCAFSPFC